MSLQFVTATVTCSNEECEEDIEVKIYPGRPAQTYGRPEDCYPEEPPEFDPEECPICDHELDLDSIDIGELWQDQADDYPELDDSIMLGLEPWEDEG